MNEPTPRPEAAAESSRDELMAAHFANLVLQHTQMGLMLMGKTPRPDSGENVRDLDHAQLVIDQLEMLEAKTKGNLSKDEAGLLKQSLMTLRLAFVEAVDAAPGPTQESQPASRPHTAATPAETPAATPTPEEDSRKKFSKKY